MKKITTKLALSVTSLGLAIATLSTTTFAWYTSNMSVSASGVEGTTSAATDNTLLISKTGADGSFSASVELTASDYTVDGTSMIPLQYNNGFNDIEGQPVASAKNDKNYLQFSVFVKTQSSTVSNDNQVPVYLQSLTIENQATLDQLTSYDILTDYTNGWTESATTYKVDAAQALNLAIASKAGTANNKSEDVGTELYSVNTLVGTTKNENLGTAADALSYYNEVMGTSKDRTGMPTTTELETVTASEATESNAISVVSLASTGIYEIIFTVYLDGWDKYCFDACRNQKFNIEFALTTDIKNVTVVKPTA